MQEKRGIYISAMYAPCQSSSQSLSLRAVVFFSFSLLFSSIDLSSTWCWRIYLLFTPKFNEKQPHTLVHCVRCTAAYDAQPHLFDDVAMMRSTREFRFLKRLSLSLSREHTKQVFFHYFFRFCCCSLLIETSDQNLWTRQINLNYVFSTDNW